MIRSKTAMGFLWALLALALQFWPFVPGARAQGSRKDDIVFNSRGVPLAGATIRVCTMPATGQPCTPIANIYSDSALTQALANPTTTDGLGNYFFYAAPGRYMIEISGPGITTKQIPDVIIPADPTSPSFNGNISAFSLNLSGNLTVNGNTTVLGNLAGGTLTMADQSTAPGAASAGTVNLYVKSSDKRLYYKDDNGTEIGPISSASGAQTNVANTFTAPQTVDANLAIKGPSPWMDVTRYGVRAVSSTPTTTATISASSNSAAVASATGFQVGDGFLVYGAGSAITMSTPSAPTVTTPVTGGATTYGYKIIATDTAGGHTAATSEVLLTTGPSALGHQTAAISSLSRSGNTVTVTLASAPAVPIWQWAQIYISGTTNDSGFSGWETVASVTDSTHFTFTDGRNSNFGDGASATGGTLDYWSYNVLTLPTAGTGVWEYCIYGRTQGAETFLGCTTPINDASNNDPNYLKWYDYGSPMMDSAPQPGWIPSAPPTSAQSDYLSTTITGISGTTFTLANAASTAVTSATALFDDGPGLYAAEQVARGGGGGYGNGMLYIPPIPAGCIGCNYIVASNLSMSTPYNVPLGVDQAGPVTFLGTLSTYNVKWYGDRTPNSGALPQFALMPMQKLLFYNAVPGVNAGLNTYFSGVDFAGYTNAYTLVYATKGSLIMEKSAFTGGSSNADYTGVGLFIDGGSSSQTLRLDDMLSSPALPQTHGATPKPYLFIKNIGSFNIDGIYTNRRGIYMQNVNQVDVNFRYDAQGLITPLVTLAAFGGTITNNLIFKNPEIDTSADPVFFNSTGQGLYSVELDGGIGPQSGYSWVTGYPLQMFIRRNAGLTAPPASTYLGQTTNSEYDGYSTVTDGTVNPSLTPGATSPKVFARPTVIAGGWNLFALDPAMAQPTATVSSGGSLSVGNYYFSLTPVYANGGDGTASPNSATVSTTSGNQTITVTWTAAAGAIGYDIYANGVAIGCSHPYITSGATTSFVWSGGSPCGVSSPSFPGTGSAAIGAGYIQTPKLLLGSNTLAPPSGVTSKTWTFADHNTQYAPGSAKPSSNIGFTLESGMLQSAFDDFNRANGAIGSNWTVMTGGLNVSGNQLVGTGTTDNRAFYSSAAVPVTADQFSQLTLGNLPASGNGTYAMVRASGSGSTADGYMCGGGASGTLYLQKITNGADSVITSTSFSPSIGDVIRLEAVGSTLNCYYNGVLKLTSTDSSFAFGSPALEVYNTGALADNWSGGNLNPLAHLNLEQDWAQPQHFPLGITVGPLSLAGTPPSGITIGAESFNSVPRAFIPTFLPGALTSTWTGATVRLDKAITVTRVQVQAKTAPAGCTTNAVVQLTDGTTPVNLTISAAANDSGAISQNYAAGAALTIAVQTAAAGCTTAPADANVVVQYKMQ